MGNIHFEGHWKEWALKIETFVGPEMATSEAKFSGTTPSNDLHYEFALIKIIKSKLHIKKQVHW